MLKRGGFIDEGLLVFFALAGIVFAGLIVALLALDRVSCNNKAEVMGLQSRWGFTTGCMVKAEGRYVPLGAVRFVDGRMQVDMSESGE